jgi:hypothetical protein
MLRIYLQIGNTEAGKTLLSEIETKVQEIVHAKHSIDSVDVFVDTSEQFTDEELELITLLYCDR